MNANYSLTHHRAISPVFLLAVIVTIVVNFGPINQLIQNSTLTSTVKAHEQYPAVRLSQPGLAVIQPQPVPTPHPLAATPVPAQHIAGKPLGMQPDPRPLSVPTPPAH